MPRSLYAKLAGALFLLLLAVAAVYLGVTLWSTRLYLQDAQYRLHRGLAASFVSEGLLGQEGRVGEGALQQVFHTLMLVNPSIEVYLTDAAGRLLAFSAPPGRVKLERIDLAPVRRFLEQPQGVPVLGDDPRHPGARAVFSVAPVPAAGETRGYLYVVLAGEPYRSALGAFRASHVARLAVAITAGTLGVVLAVGLGCFFWLTRPLRRLSAQVEAFRGGAEGNPPGAAGDEIARLSAAFVQMRERIAQQLERLSRVDAERRELIGNLSHDLRTPAASLQAHLETALLKHADLDAAERRRCLEVAVGSSRRLAGLLDELFELATLDDPARSPVREPFNLPELVQDVAQKWQASLQPRGLRLTVDPPGDLPLACGDLALVERLVENLFSNAVRHSPDGGVIRVSFQRPAEGCVETRVADQGPGIPANERERVFDRFSRAPDRTEPGGHGLGLAIVKRIVDLHGGTVQVDAGEPGGAVIRFTLPAAG